MTAELEKYLPESSLHYANKLISDANVALKIVNGRKTKHGDFKMGLNGNRSVITVNKTLNTYAFLITLIHEIAHAVAYQDYGRRILPHGKEWKMTFRNLMAPLLNEGVYPAELLQLLQKHMVNPKASSSADLDLFKALRKYDEKDVVYLEDIPEGQRFLLASHRIFVKGGKRRKNFLCLSEKNGRRYLIHPMAEVQALDPVDHK